MDAKSDTEPPAPASTGASVKQTHQEAPDGWDYVSRAADVLSVLGAIAAILAYFKIKSIQANFVFQARVPQLQKALEAHSKAISRILGAYDTRKTELDDEFGRCAANVRSLLPKISGSTKSTGTALLKRITKRRKNSNLKTEEEARAIYTDLNMLIEELGNVRKDHAWRARNV